MLSKAMEVVPHIASAKLKFLPKKTLPKMASPQQEANMKVLQAKGPFSVAYIIFIQKERGDKTL
jgi:hypothetical protein